MQVATEVTERVFAKITWRLMPFLIVAYVLNYLDRNNVGFAALTMNQELGLTPLQFGNASGILFLGYCFFEIPSNIALYRVGARIWLSRIMITWGLVSAATIFVTGANSLYLLRFLLGVAEAGFFPGVAYYLGTWFPTEYRTRAIAWFMVAIPVSSVIGGPISGLLLAMDGVAGLAGWKWLFLVEGLPVCLLGVAALWVLADRPEDAKWLTEEERQIVRDRLASERREREVKHLLPALKDTRVLVLAGVQFGFLVGSVRRRTVPATDTERRPAVRHRSRIRLECLLRRGVGWHDRVGDTRRATRRTGRQPHPHVPRRGRRISRRDLFESILGLDRLADGRAHGNQRGSWAVLDDTAAISDRDGGSRRPGLHQLNRDHGRVRRTDRDGMADRSIRLVFRRTRRHGGVPAARGRVVLVAEAVREAGLARAASSSQLSALSK